VELRVEKRTGKISGLVYAKSDMIMKGYYKNPNETAEVIKDGWLNLRIIGYIDKNGALFVKKDIRDIITTEDGRVIHIASLRNYILKNQYIEDAYIYYSEREKKIVLRLIPNRELVQKKFKTFYENIKDEELFDFFKREVRKLSFKLPSYKRIKMIELIRDRDSLRIIRE
jgi:long-chain acyl-CoA synthetase